MSIARATELPSSDIDRALIEIRYGTASQVSMLESGEVKRYYGEIYNEDEFGNVLSSDVTGMKSPVKAGILSLLVPGLGQLYNGSHPGKIAGFAALEGFFWYKFSDYNTDANDKVDEFEAFADELWSEQEYYRYLLEAYNETNDSSSFHSHHLPATKTQQYYEMIGKYDQFSYGWAPGEGDSNMTYTSADRYPGNAYPSQNRLDYNQMRGDANDLFSDRDRMFVFVILNHLAAGIDAAIGATRHNKTLKHVTPGVSLTPTVTPGPDLASTPRIGLELKF